ncbi:MAG: hypothetical protein H6Q89_1705 [Myxococcaceae bacterium]|nr:hypothetical protein [Myxococcaceae bacterium]
MPPPTVALVTMEPMPATAEHRALAAALDQRGVIPVDVAWDHPFFDWSKVQLAVLRSCWDYHLQPERFLAWARGVPRLLNPYRVVEWNSHKGYLRQLEARSVPTIETVWVPAGPAPLLPQLLKSRGWHQAVVKPCVSAAAYRTVRCSALDWREGQQLLGEICEKGEAMVQRYLPTVETSQERSLVFIDGVFSHAVRREPVLTTKTHAASLAVAADDERWVAEHALRGLEFGPLLFARVDLLRDERGDLRVMELELIEPTLFLEAHPPAADSLAEAIVRRLGDWLG